MREAGRAKGSGGNSWGRGRGIKALLHSLRQSLLMKQQRLDAPVFEFWYLVADDLRQHLREFHTEGFIHKGVETDLQKTLDHLRENIRTFLLVWILQECTRVLFAFRCTTFSKSFAQKEDVH